MIMLKPFEHQAVTTDHILANDFCLITSDPGTGKTRSVLDALTKRGSRTLVLHRYPSLKLHGVMTLQSLLQL